MNLKNLFITLFLVFSTTLISAQCPTGDVTLGNQSDVDAFVSAYPTCEVIDGDLLIGSNVTDISNLTSIKRVEGSLRILYSEITSVANFSSLEFIGGDFEIKENSLLTIISGINNLTTIGYDLNIHANFGGLTTIEGFESLTNITNNLNINFNPPLQTVSGFDNLVNVGGWLTISNNDFLLSIPSFNQLLSVVGSLIITSNDTLTDINGFNSLEDIGMHLNMGNDELTSIQGFENLIQIAGYFDISSSSGIYSPNLSVFPEFNNLEIIGGGFEISETALTSLSGFNSLISIGSWFILIENNELNIIDGFNNLNHIYGVVQIIVNDSLESLIGFSNLEIVGGLFQLNLNPSLTSLTGLESLIQVAGPSYINDYSFFITDNISLTDCSAICNLLAINGITGFIEIEGNPSECSSEEEIREVCIPDFDDDTILDDDDLDDDNDGILDTVEQNGTVDRDTDNDGFPDHRDLDSDADGCFDVLEAGFTDNDQNGTLGDLPDTVDINGLIIGETDGYTTPLDANTNGIFDFQEDLILNAGNNGTYDSCINDSPVDLFYSLEGTPNIGGTWSPVLSSGTGFFDPLQDASGTYTYTVNNGVCGSDSAEVIVAIFFVPNSGSDGSIDLCIDNTPIDLFDSLNGTPDAGGDWSPVLSSGTGMFNPSIDADGIYTYAVTNSCGTVTSQVEVIVFDILNAGENGVLDICFSDSPVDLFDSLEGTPEIGGEWSPALTSGTGVFDPSIDAEGIYTYTIISAVCGNQSAEVSVTIFQASNAGNNGVLEVCSVDFPVDLFDSLEGTPDSGGVWTPTLTSGTGVFDPSIDTKGVYTYTVGNDICGYESSEVNVTILTPPNPGTNGDLEICEINSSVDLFDYLNGNPDSGGIWAPTLASGTGVFDPSIDAEGIYTYTVSNGTCESQSSEVAVLVIDEFPILDYTINIYEENNYLYTIEILINSDLDYEYSLDNINYQTNNSFTHLSGGNYTIHSREIDGCGLLEEDIVLIYYPNFFTPNGDGENDTWKIEGITNQDYTVSIHDRFGKILTQLSPQDEWDGYYNGVELPSTDYWFELVLEDGTVKTGHFALKR